MRFIEKNKRGIAIFMLLSILNDTFFPSAALALTSGPSQPESSNFTPVSTSDMVNLFTGDFNYNIPLLDVGGYPVNISYNGGSFMDQEASWVGLGWNINVGAVNRNMRGLPDDFAGDIVTKELNTKANETYGVSIGPGGEAFGFEGGSISPSMGISYDNYKGFNITQSIGLSLTPIKGFPGTIGLGLSSSTDGLTISPKIGLSSSFSKSDKESGKGSVSVGTSYNSRSGLKQVSFGAQIDASPSLKNVASISAGYNFGAATYVPNVGMAMHNVSYIFSLGLGGTIYGTDVTGNITGSYSKQALREYLEEIPAYGYMYAQAGEEKDKVLLDFNREKDGSFSENSVILPLTNHTYDIFSVCGQGISGSYRAMRSDIGYVFDSRVNSDSESDNLSTEIEIGGSAKPGVDYYQTNIEQTSGKWSDDNSLKDRLKFRGSGDNAYYEPAYFKQAGEMTVDEDNLYAAVIGNKSVRPDFGTAGFDSYTNFNLKGPDGLSGSVPTTPYRTKRAKRNQFFSYLTKDSYQAVALQAASLYSLIPSSLPGHHIAEITSTKTDGTRYVFGLPLVNTKQVERTFATNSLSPATTPSISYSATDDSKNNSKGLDNYFSSTELPPYAYSYLLTAVLSPDYIDLTGNGPSTDDLGNYTLFKYGKNLSGTVTPGTFNYKWRTPTGAYANYDPGLYSVGTDDKGSYVYGEKQITNLTHIYSKNFVAVFEHAARKDGFGVTGSTGAINTSTAQLLLKSIKLYSLPDYNANQNTASVIKQVDFVYDYSLCTDGGNALPNNNYNGTPGGTYEQSNSKGKLTLKKIYIANGNSKKGYLSPYEFEYNTTVIAGGTTTTPTYNMKACDRWGTYKPSASNPTNSEAPYTSQDKNSVDSYAALWNLKAITLPSGGKITVDLESDDYAFVQNKRAAEMFRIVGTDDVAPSGVQTNFSVPTANTLFVGSTNYNVMFFALDQPISLVSGTAAAVNKFKKEYMENIADLNFRFFAAATGSTTADYEFVSGYAEILNSGIVSTGTASADYGWVELKEVNRGDKKSTCTFCENPIARACWQFGRMHAPDKVFAITSPPTPSGSISEFIKACANANFFKNTVQFFLGANGVLKLKSIGRVFDTNKSFIKLNNPNRCRLGGGNRVKRITMSDEWANMITTNTSGKTSQYGQNYVYTTSDANTSYLVSSGVAAYEPGFGAIENACRYPIYNSGKKQELLLAPDNDLYQEGPIGESFFPAPTVGYSKVTVSNLTYTNVTKNATGYIVNEFYTAKDFPVIVHKPTDLHLKRTKSNPLQKILHLEFEDNMTASQGYCIELNDMHGKQKAVSIYDATGSKISGNVYSYKQSGETLNNNVPYMKKDGTIVTDGYLGVEFDMVADFREQKSFTETIGVQSQLYFMMIGLYPLLVPVSIPSYHREKVRFRSAVATKVVQRFGILEKVSVEDNGNTVETSNVLWDGETGEVLLTKTNTEFSDDIYNYNYPAYYAYSGMEPSYRNNGMFLQLSSTANNLGKVYPGYKSYLEPGDECMLLTSSLTAVNTSTNTNLNKVWVRQQGNDYYLIDAAGLNAMTNNTFSTAVYMSVIRSGKRNQQSVHNGNLVTFNCPVTTTANSIWPTLDATKNVLNASAVEFGNTWRTMCKCNLPGVGQANSNEYLTGRAGVWRQMRSYTYLTLRKQTNLNNNTNIRKDGVYEKFDPFWSPNGGGNWSKPTDLNSPSPKWTWASEVTEYSPYGYEVENKDALGRYSAAVYGYNNTLPVAVGVNTKYRQFGADNFEDYGFSTCYDDGHLSFNSQSQATLTTYTNTVNYQKYAHTGLRSIKVVPTATVLLFKDLTGCQ